MAFARLSALLERNSPRPRQVPHSWVHLAGLHPLNQRALAASMPLARAWRYIANATDDSLERLASGGQIEELYGGEVGEMVADVLVLAQHTSRTACVAPAPPDALQIVAPGLRQILASQHTWV